MVWGVDRSLQIMKKKKSLVWDALRCIMAYFQSLKCHPVYNQQSAYQGRTKKKKINLKENSIPIIFAAVGLVECEIEKKIHFLLHLDQKEVGQLPHQPHLLWRHW